MSLQPESAVRRDGPPAPLPFTMKTAGIGRDVGKEGARDGAKAAGTDGAPEDAKGARKDVTRLEFSSVDGVPVPGSADADAVEHLREEVAALQAKLNEQRQAVPRQVDEAKLLARLLARKEWEEELERRTQEDRASVRRACEAFDRERTRYFAAVEGQVVKLALAIAGHVLHREAKMDPLLLLAAVRVALEKVKDESDTRLRVPLAEVAAWNAALGNAALGAGPFGSGPDGNNQGAPSGAHPGSVQVVGDTEMTRGECVIETNVGTVEMGIEAQLLEIEQGFFDLLKKRPA